MKLKRRLSNLLILSSIVLLLALGQDWLTQVSAQVSAITLVSPDHLDFGLVFPEEKLGKSLMVSNSGSASSTITATYHLTKYTGESYNETFIVKQGDSVKYFFNEKLKPDGDGGYYPDLCPSIDETSHDGEGDTSTAAYLSPDDSDDSWSVDLDTPCLAGYVPQGDDCQTIPKGGVYGCDLGLNEEGLATIFSVDIPEAYLDLTSADPMWDSYDPATEKATWNIVNRFPDDEWTVTITVYAHTAATAAETAVSYHTPVEDIPAKYYEDIGTPETVAAPTTKTTTVPPGEILGIAVGPLGTGANLIYNVLGSLAALSTGLWLRRCSSSSLNETQS